MHIGLNEFVNGGSDEALLKALSGDSRFIGDELEKAMNKQGLVQVQITVQGKHGAYTRMQWKRASDVKANDTVVGGQKQADTTPATQHKLPDGITLGKDGKVSWDDNKLDETDVLDVLCGKYTFFDAKDDIYDKVMPFIHHDDPDFEDDGSGSFAIDSIKIVGNEVEITGTITLEGITRNGHNATHAKTAKTKIPLLSSIQGTLKPEPASTPNISFEKPKDGDGKKALSAMLSSGKSRNDIMSAAKAAGIIWKENAHEGINWMRAAMAIQKHMSGGSTKAQSSTSVKQQQSKKQEPKMDKSPVKLPDGVTMSNSGKLSWDNSKIDASGVLDDLCGDDSFMTAKDDIQEQVMPLIYHDNPDFDEKGGEFTIDSLEISGNEMVVTGTLTVEGYNIRYDESEEHSMQAKARLPLKKANK